MVTAFAQVPELAALPKPVHRIFMIVVIGLRNEMGQVTLALSKLNKNVQGMMTVGDFLDQELRVKEKEKMLKQAV